jgi:hypothetical protein
MDALSPIGWANDEIQPHCHCKRVNHVKMLAVVVTLNAGLEELNETTEAAEMLRRSADGSAFANDAPILAWRTKATNE